MTTKALTYWSDSLARGEVQETKLIYEFTGAKALKDRAANAALVSFDAIASQAVIDNFLGTSSEFLLAAFAATPMGTDAVAFIVNMGGQCAELVSATLILRSSTGLATVSEATQWGSTSAMGTTLANGIQQGANGNVAARFVVSGLDSITAGQAELKLYWRSK